MFKESRVKLSTRVALSIIIEETRCNRIEVLQKATGGSDMGMDISLFARLETEENTAVLPIQYRMNQ
ncbi:hypothetical protein IscW_ISCW000878 [Ixodes scapularis]|uniref:Uncharacterized protein n=1 Tax=Ixodes scapularis TaxID=6945 RepID=B7P3Y0_IXOSC|nr:hypothetical protein IscW_ISCW000878 [Ixodes scapularis]|eukprot:XP_002404812.1 hypothetical protein IscW_ISCW000878 [Ixodes scapularis]